MFNQTQRQRMRRTARTFLHLVLWWVLGLLALAAWLALDVPQASAAAHMAAAGVAR